MISRARLDVLLSGLGASPKKVYDVVPMAESWPISKVISEMQRVGISIDYRVVGGCLDTLVRAGLICEPKRGEFRREPIRPTPTPKNESPMNNKTAIPTKPPTRTVTPPIEPAADTEPSASPATPMDILGGLAVRAAAIGSAVKELADDIANAAIDIQQVVELNSGELAKLRQFRALLKSLE